MTMKNLLIVLVSLLILAQPANAFGIKKTAKVVGITIMALPMAIICLPYILYSNIVLSMEG